MTRGSRGVWAFGKGWVLVLVELEGDWKVVVK
jgi:hypothetical protein